MHVSKEQTRILKGIAIIMVLFGHLIPQFLPYADLYVPVKRMVSQLGVEIFMIISGYGVMVAYIIPEKKPAIFFAKRFVQLWPVYAFAMLAYFLMSKYLFGDNVTFQSLFLNLLWLQVFFNVQNDIYSAAHFFSALLIVYFITFIALTVGFKRHKALVVSAGFIAVQLIYHVLFGRYIFTDYIASFSFGLFLASCISEKNTRFNYFYLLTFIFCLSDSYSLMKLLVGCAVFLLLLRILQKQLFAAIQLRILNIFGIYSYIIYLSHNYFVWKWPQIVAEVGSKLETGGVIIIATLAWTICLFTINSLYIGKILPSLLVQLSKRSN